MRLTENKWLAAPDVQAVFEALLRGGHQARAVGGAVRNALLGLPIADVDIATTASPEQVERSAAQAGLRTIATGRAHGTITVLSGAIAIEVTTLRRDIATDGRHALVAFTDDWEADAARRDFTINAIYADRDGTVFDPLSGRKDIEAHRVRFIGVADDRIAEDYLRILRFFRFHAQFGHGQPDAEGLQACLRARAGLDRLSRERVRVELLKLLVAPGALGVVLEMEETGILQRVLGLVTSSLALRRLIELEARLRLPPDAIRRLAVLAIRTSEQANLAATRLRLSNQQHGRIRNPLAVPPDLLIDEMPAAMRRQLHQVGTHGWRDAVLYQFAVWPIQRVGGARPWPDDQVVRSLLALPSHWTPPVLPVNGHDLLALGVLAGENMGTMLRHIEAEWVRADFSLTRAELLDRARELSCK